MTGLWLGCSAALDTAQVSGRAPADTGEQLAVDACEVEVEPPEDEAVTSCDADRCEVAAGLFVYGRSDAATPDRCPARLVELSAFAIDRYEVSVERWDGCVAEGACEALPGCGSGATVGRPEALPATCVSWEAASAFCAWTGGRLPTEAEWEKAARGTRGATYPWGDDTLTCDRANYHDVTFYCQGGPVEVDRASYEPGAHGLAQAAGNVWEWVEDAYDAGWYREAGDVDPEGPTSCSLQVGGERGACDQRVLRGGAWNSARDVLEVTTRSFGPPALMDDNVGFRCAY